MRFMKGVNNVGIHAQGRAQPGLVQVVPFIATHQEIGDDINRELAIPQNELEDRKDGLSLDDLWTKIQLWRNYCKGFDNWRRDMELVTRRETTMKGPHSREVEQDPLPHRFKVLNIPQYNGDGDPYDHLDVFNVQMDLQTSSSLAKCRVFPTTLRDIPQTWLRSLPPCSICSWEECQMRFINQYKSLRR